VAVEGDDVLAITPPTPPASPAAITPAAIDTYDDHRMAMSFAVAGTRAAGVTIRNKECVNKTYPEFFEDLRKVTKM
jgi:3-phosphoshikimate 1-carboxyvinyltransferase